MKFNNKQIFFAQNIVSAPVNPCVLWNLTADSSPCYEADTTKDLTATATPFTLRFSADGSKVYVITGPFSRDMHEYDLTTNWDITDGVTYNQSYTFTNLVAGGDYVNGFDFSPDGTKLIVGMRDANDGRLQTYLLSSAWDISTISYSAQTGLQGSYHTSLNVLSGGTIVVGVMGNYFMRQYVLSTPYNVTTASLTTSFYQPTGAGRGHIWTKPDGTRIYTDVGGQYNLSTPFDLTTAVLQSGTLSFAGSGIAYSSDGTKFYFIDDSDNLAQWVYTGT